MQKLGFLTSILLLTAALVGPIGFSFAETDTSSENTSTDTSSENTSTDTSSENTSTDT
ncbi:MAG: hypothetical protein HW420_911, partial [Candidatus Nitrosotenuis sp.]|nr:hypothetical protein [Candidatus Nitrosotenuis sp.]